MIPVDQTVLHDPPESVGNCCRAAIASVLEVDIDDIPAFEIPMFEDKDWWPLLRDWSRQQGLRILFVTRKRVTEKNVPLPDGFTVASGPSPRFDDCLHSVVWEGGLEGSVVHDPHPDRDGISGPPRDWIVFETIEDR